MAIDSLELQLASALQRYDTLQRRASTQRESGATLTKTLAELGTALEELRVAQEQLIENRGRMEQLQVELHRQYEKYWQLFDEMPEAYVVTKGDTTILEANKAAGQLFNVSQRFLVGKTLSVFVCEDRPRFLAASTEAASALGPQEWVVKLRPRERAPLPVAVRVSGDSTALRWVLRPVPSAQGIDDTL